MKRLLVPFVVGIASAATLAAPAGDSARWWSYVQALANDQMRGRNTGKEVIAAGTEYDNRALWLEGMDWLVEGVTGSTKG